MMRSTVSTTALLGRYVGLVPALAQSLWSDRVRIHGLRLHVPGSRTIRASVLAGNARMRAIIDRVVSPGATVVDVGANIGAIAAHAARRVGPRGRVFAIEPARDNLAVLDENLRSNDLTNVTVIAAAAGRRRETREFYLRGDVSAVNSLFPESCYASVSEVVSVELIPLDEIVDGPVALLKIDVEGAELDVLHGAARLIAQPGIVLVVEWHPALQRAAGYGIEALPRFLLSAGFSLTAVGHLRAEALTGAGIPAVAARLLDSGHPVELLCVRAS